MKKIYLSLNSVDLGYLIQTTSGFKFIENEHAITNLKQDDLLTFQLFNIQTLSKQAFTEIPKIYQKFLPSKERKDLIKKANILETDSNFDKLYKLAGLNVMAINFKIHQ